LGLILDTNALSALAVADPDIAIHFRSSAVHGVPAIVLGEYRYGLRRSIRAPQLAQWLDRLEQRMEILDITRSTAVYYAELRDELRALGRPIPENDVWIAALTREHGLSLLSRDAHFDLVPDLVRQGW